MYEGIGQVAERLCVFGSRHIEDSTSQKGNICQKLLNKTLGVFVEIGKLVGAGEISQFDNAFGGTGSSFGDECRFADGAGVAIFLESQEHFLSVFSNINLVRIVMEMKLGHPEFQSVLVGSNLDSLFAH